MAELIIYRGNSQITVSSPSDVTYVYRIGSGSVLGEGFTEINDKHRLHALAQEIRDDYSQWIYSLNDLFLASRLKTDDLSLFFLTDLSCKRGEFFETFDYLCGLLLIQERLVGVEISQARLIGVDRGFERAFRSVFPKTTITTVNCGRGLVSAFRRLSADALFLWRVMGAIVINKKKSRKFSNKDQSGRTFFSIYPQMFSNDDIETKYVDLPKTTDNYVVSVLTDGMHQKTSITKYVRWANEAEKKGFQVMDRHLSFADLFSALYWFVRLWTFFLNQRNHKSLFNHIDISGLKNRELLFSISRVMRLWILKGALRRFLETSQICELVYYPCEYPLGRMISYVTASCDPPILRTGFQMSIVSQRRLEQFLAPNESSTKPPFFHHAPIPDRVLAEDAEAATIYKRSGYKNVQLMEKIYRFGYLKGIRPEKKCGQLLIVPGLHDGAMILEQMKTDIVNNPKKVYIVKPHPRANNQYLAAWSCFKNVQISIQPVAELLGVVSKVFVTYSSVGIEAKRLGLDVIVIDVPGRINTSPLLDLFY